jgi:16S rRNA (guanine1516-N2)-methyltransferase
VRVAVAKKSPEATGSESRLAANLKLPIIEINDPESACDFDYLFFFDGPKLTLLATNAAAGGELCVDFSEAKLNYRAKSSIKDQSIARAIGVKGGKRPSVLDATAGLGKDAFLLASFGCSVALLERSALIHALLEDGLERRGYYGAETAEILSRMDLARGEFLDFEPVSPQFDVVYLDPMFPARRKSAKVKKDMAALQKLLGYQSDGSELLQHAKRLATKRVVVKRAKTSPHLGTDAPDIEFKGSSSRYDVYLIANQSPTSMG